MKVVSVISNVNTKKSETSEPTTDKRSELSLDHCRLLQKEIWLEPLLSPITSTRFRDAFSKTQGFVDSDICCRGT